MLHQGHKVAAAWLHLSHAFPSNVQLQDHQYPLQLPNCRHLSARLSDLACMSKFARASRRVYRMWRLHPMRRRSPNRLARGASPNRKLRTICISTRLRCKHNDGPRAEWTMFHTTHAAAAEAIRDTKTFKTSGGPLGLGL